MAEKLTGQAQKYDEWLNCYPHLLFVAQLARQKGRELPACILAQETALFIVKSKIWLQI